MKKKVQLNENSEAMQMGWEWNTTYKRVVSEGWKDKNERIPGMLTIDPCFPQTEAFINKPSIPLGFPCRPCVWWSWKLWLHCPAGLNRGSMCVWSLSGPNESACHWKAAITSTQGTTHTNKHTTQTNWHTPCSSVYNYVSLSSKYQLTILWSLVCVCVCFGV